LHAPRPRADHVPCERASAELLAGATAVFHDYLVSAAVLSRCHPAALVADVGKIGHGARTAQRDIEQRLIAAAREGYAVVRLKGGDPLLFGRGAEEALALEAAGIPFEIVPGVSSALAVPAYAGIPVTARGHAASVAIVTGHCVSGRPTVIPIADTIVVLMGVANAAAIRDQLVATGLDGATPAAIVEWGTCERQRVTITSLAELPAAIAREGAGAPATIVIGEVVRLRDRLDWLNRAPGVHNHVQAANSHDIFVAT
jgi:uroporphyrin-III C-methyltransferase